MITLLVVLTSVTVVNPLFGSEAFPLTISPVLIPTTESIVIVLTPVVAGAVTTLELVTSPITNIGSLTVTAVELTEVVVPSICKLPLMIT